MQTTLRNATIGDLADLLKENHARKLDVVAPASAIRSEGGSLVLEGVEAEISDDGVTAVDGRYIPTVVCDEGIADKLGVPVAYLKRMRAERPDLYDANVNGWLHGGEWTTDGLSLDYSAPGDVRSFLVRCFRGDDSTTGIARAFLSNGFKIIDDLDALTAALEGIRESGAHVEIDGCDLTERRMHVRLVAPEITALAPVLLGNYRNPFDGAPVPTVGRRADFVAAAARFGWSGDMPVVFAGLVLSNSETGNGAFTLAPQIKVATCWNGMTMTQDILRRTHLGSKMDDGVVKWSVDTQERNLGLIAAQTRDAVATFLDVEYVKAKVDEIEAKAGRPLAEPAKVVETVCKRLVYSEARTASVLDLFIRGGDATTGGVMQAVTAAAQIEPDADEAARMESDAIRALDFAVAAS